MKICYNSDRSFKKGAVPWNKGKKSPWTTKRNLERNHLMIGENAYHWKGGKTTRERKILMGRKKYQLWRLAVLERDSWTCQSCRIKGESLHAHHIKPWASYPDLRYDVENGVALCVPCHQLLHSMNSNKK